MVLAYVCVYILNGFILLTTDEHKIGMKFELDEKSVVRTAVIPKIRLSEA